MKSSLIRPLLMGVFAFPLLVAAQQGVDGRWAPGLAGAPGIAGVAGLAGAGGVPGAYSDPGNHFSSNVPINELNARAYRRFHRRFREVVSGENWFKSVQGYKVSFVLDAHQEFAYYDPSGGFLYSLRYFDGKEVPGEMGEFVKRRFPGFKIDLVTEVNDGQKTFYTLQIMNPDYVKVLSIVDGRMEILDELSNGGAHIGLAAAAR
jgi:hypothetical protein